MTEELKRLKEERREFWNKYKEYYDGIPLNCKLCKEFLEDSGFLENNKVPYGCGETENAKANFLKNCDVFKFSKWRMTSMFKKLTKKIKELERIVQIHETFMKKQYQYDKSLIMKRFECLEKKIKYYHVDPKDWIKKKENR